MTESAHRVGDTQVVEVPDMDEPLRREPSTLPTRAGVAGLLARSMTAKDSATTLERIRELARALVGEGQDSDSEMDEKDDKKSDEALRSIVSATMAHLDSKTLADVKREADVRLFPRCPTPVPGAAASSTAGAVPAVYVAPQATGHNIPDEDEEEDYDEEDEEYINEVLRKAKEDAEKPDVVLDEALRKAMEAGEKL